MSTLNGKTIGALAGVTMLAVSGAASVMPAVAQPIDNDAAAVEQVAAEKPASDLRAPVVAGEFSFSQETLTSNEALKNVFSKAAATLCQSATLEVLDTLAAPIAVSVNGASAYDATVADMAQAEGATSFIMGCTCASNVAGGGAIANTEVQGVTLESVFAQAQAAGK